MRIGIVADIHDAVEHLTLALALLKERGAECIVTLGDAFETLEPGSPGPEVARLLHRAGAVGVWGNHDFALSHDVPEEIRKRADPDLLAFSTLLQPQLVVGSCRFCHIEPRKDVFDLMDLWTMDGFPETAERAEKTFAAVPERIVFMGHLHWAMVAGRAGRIEWDGVETLRLSGPDRYLFAVPAVLSGWCALFDTDRSELTTIRCSRATAPSTP
jgi:predicted phosphodiesterase